MPRVLTWLVTCTLLALVGWLVYSNFIVRTVEGPGFKVEFDEPAPARIRVDRASFGVDGRFSDMTAFLQGECNGRESCAWQGNPHLVVGDPYPGKPKQVSVRWQCDGKSKNRVFPESQMVGGKTNIFLECR